MKIVYKLYFFKMIIKRIILFIFLFFISIFWFSYWTDLGSSTPTQILDWMKNNEIQKTKLNDVNWDWIDANLSSIKSSSSDYIKWLWFIWLSVALILIIYNGMYLLANFSDEDKLSKVKKRFVSLIIGVIVLTSWYLIIKFAVSIIWNIF